MASRSSSSSMPPVLPHSLVPAHQSHHLVTPVKQISNQPEPSDPNEDSVIAPSPSTLLSENRYVCEVCFKGFLRKQNLTLHRRSHNLPFCLKTRTPKDPVRRKLYLCPETTCQHHNLIRPLGDFGGLKKHYLRKHCTEKNFKCDTCSKMYAAETDLKAHIKVCGKRRYVCHCGARFARSYNFVSHQECCAAQKPKVAAGHSPTLQMGDRLGNGNFLKGSSSSYAPTYNMKENSMRNTSNDNHSNLIGLYTSHSDPNISAIQNLSKSYPSAALHQSQLCPSGRNNGSLMTDPSIGSNMGQMFPDFFSPSSTPQNQHKHQAGFDMRFYTDLLMDKIPLDNVNHMGDGGNIYGNGGGSNSNSSGGAILDQSSSHNLIPGVHNTSLNWMPNPVSGGGCSTFNQEFDSSYDQGSNYGYGDCNGQSNFETSATTAGEVAPYGQILNQFRGFWF